MVTAWQQDRRRGQARQLRSEAVAGLEDILGGISEEERRRRLAEEQARKAEATAFDREMRQGVADRADAAAARQQQASEAMAQDRASRTGILRQKQERDDRERMQAEAARKLGVDMAGVSAAQGAPTGGVSAADLEQRGRAVGLSGKELLAMVDAETQKGLQAEEMRGAKLATEEAKAAAAERANRPKALRPRGGDPEIAALKKRKLLAETQKAEREARGEGGAKAPKPELTTGEVESVVELQGAMNLLNQLASMKRGDATGEELDTGPLINAWDWLRAQAGQGEPQRVKFKALVGTQIAEYIKSISGATVSEPERAQLLQNVPTASDNDDAFVAKLETVQGMIQNKLNTKRRAFEATGRSTKIFEPSPEDAAEADALFAD